MTYIRPGVPAPPGPRVTFLIVAAQSSHSGPRVSFSSFSFTWLVRVPRTLVLDAGYGYRPLLPLCCLHLLRIPLPRSTFAAPLPGMLLTTPVEAGSCCASSVSSAAAQSLLSGDTVSTGLSTPDLSPQPLPARAILPLLDPSVKASTIRLPLQLPLPPAPFAEIDLKSLILDDELGDAPVGFAVGKLRHFGQRDLVPTMRTIGLT